jgi:hemolysin activation/secretion protein
VGGIEVKLRASSASHRLWLASAGAALVWSPPAKAQTQPNVPRPPTREEVERPLPRESPGKPRLSVEGDIERAPCALAAEAYSAIRFTPRSVSFGGLKGLAPEALRPAYEPYLGREQPLSVICEIRDRAATILREAGYIAAVEIPEQHIAGGDLRLEVLMARLVAIRVRGDAGRSERTIARYLEKLTHQEVFNRYQAERYLLLARDLPGYDVRLALKSAGAGRGEVIAEVTVRRRAGELIANVQNLGSSELGRWGGLVRGELYGLTGLGDRTTLAAYATADGTEQRTLQAGHEFRIGGEGLTLGGQLTYAWARPDLDDPALDVRAKTLLASIEASYPLVLTQAAAVRGRIGFEWIDQDVRINALPLSRDRLRVAYATLDFERTDRGSYGRVAGYSGAEPRWRVGGSLQLRRGLGILGASQGCGPSFLRCIAPGAVPPSRFEGDATATLVRFRGAAEFRPTPKLSFALGVNAQYADRPLLAFEEFSAGNYTIGRGYDPGVLLGDRGVGAQAEIRYGSLVPRKAGALALQPFLFADAAWIRNEDRVFALAERRSLASVGGGVRAALGDGARLEALIAVPLRRAGLQARRGDPRLLVSLTTRLWPWSLK